LNFAVRSVARTHLHFDAALVGVLSADDALARLAEELYCLAGMMAHGGRHEHSARKAKAA
jgi:hypothetical protein